MDVPPLGTGVVYWPALDSVVEGGPEAVPDVIEVEPQGYWFHDQSSASPYILNPAALERLGELPQHKIIHGVGFPVGGSRRPDPRHIAPLVATIEALEAVWVSEHLSFNQAEGSGGRFNAGFLLPPLQTRDGIAAAATSIRSVSSRLPVPFAVETAVNYLQPRPGEMRDGQFTAEVVEAADCGILLDLHNLWTNERNGRQSVREFVSELPLERVWEVHLGGGIEFQGYWLDSHSGPVPREVWELAADIIPRLPNLGAVIFEILPQFVPQVGFETIREQLAMARELWASRSAYRPGAEPVERSDAEHAAGLGCPSPEHWEDTLGNLVVGRAPPPEDPLAAELASDAGVGVLHDLARTFRAGAVVANLKLTTRLLTLHGGEPFYRSLLVEFWDTAPPELFGASEAKAFATFLDRRELNVPWLYEVLGFELALMDVTIHGEPVVVPFGCDPLPLLEALGERKLPKALSPGRFELEVTPDNVGRQFPQDSGVFIGN